jgi:transposase
MSAGMDELRMSAKERIRLEAFGRVKRKELTVLEASKLMGLSVRQARRVWKRFQSESAAGLVHRLRGRLSNRRMSEDLADRIVKLHEERYADFGPTLACEKLASEHALMVSPNTLSRLLKERGLWVRRRRRGKHRKRRERRSCFGSMIQMDGSHHDWFEGRAAKCVLMVMIDDATSRTYARFSPPRRPRRRLRSLDDGSNSTASRAASTLIGTVFTVIRTTSTGSRSSGVR